MARKDFYLVVKDEVLTRFAQDADVFEPFKFVGRTMKCSAVFTKPLPEVLRNMSEKMFENQQIVGLIVPGEASVFLEGHRVISNGDTWGLVEDLCKFHDAPLLETVKS